MKPHKSSRRLFALVDVLEPRRLLAAEIVADVNLQSSSSRPIDSLVELNDKLYFTGDDGTNGRELWVSDGTPAGTHVVKDILPGPDGSQPVSLAAVGGLLYFAADDGVHGFEPWVSDGTQTGTRLLKDIVTGPAGGNASDFGLFAGEAFFAAGAPGSRTIWRSDGTEAGTNSANALGVRTGDALETAGGMLFVRANSGLVAATLDTGTGQLVMSPLLVSGNVSSLFVFGSQILATVTDSPNFGIWISDGTVANTLKLTTDVVTYNSAQPNMAVLGNELVYAVSNGLRKINGTVAGSVTVKTDFASGSNPATNLIAFDGKVYFSGRTTAAGQELWSTDGTLAGTQLIANLAADTPAPAVLSSNPRNFTVVGDKLAFTANDFISGEEVWSLQAGNATPVLSADVGGDDGSIPFRLTAVGSTLYFEADDGFVGAALWKSQLTPGTTQIVKDIYPGSDGSHADNIVPVAGKVFFTADDGLHGEELWVADGATSTMLLDIAPDVAGASIDEMIAVGSRLYFIADDDTNGVELWTSDGTAAGTRMVKDIYAGSFGSFPSLLTPFNDVVYFTAESDTSGSELWKTDGTEVGTVLVKDINTGTGSTLINEITVFDQTVYFGVNFSGGVGDKNSLWVTDGTEANTVQFTTTTLGGRQPSDLTVSGDYLYYVATSSTAGRELFRSDGTPGGTGLLKDILPGSFGFSSPELFTDVGGQMYFVANNGTNGSELWTSNGTPEGTSLVKDLHSGPDGSAINQIIAFDGKVFFTANDGPSLHGPGIFSTDGTAAGTQHVVSIMAPTSINQPAQLTPIGDLIYFTSDSLTFGREIWQTDGTAAGTRIAVDLRPGGASSLPVGLIRGGNSLYFAGDDGVRGDELWRIADALAPQIFNPEYAFDAAQPAVRFIWSENVAPTFTAGDVQLQNLTSAQTIDTSAIALTYDTNTGQVQLTFPGLSGNAMPDGNYRLTVAAGAASDPAGNPLVRAFTFEFFVFSGDANRDRTINIGDFSVLAARFNQPGTFSQGDFNYSGTVEIGDFSILASKFNQTLSPTARFTSAGPLPGTSAARNPFAAGSILSDLFG